MNSETHLHNALADTHNLNLSLLTKMDLLSKKSWRCKSFAEATSTKITVHNMELFANVEKVYTLEKA